MKLQAKRLEWDCVDDEWSDKNGIGFHIEFDEAEPEADFRYCAAWGEGESEHFATLEGAQAWCQETIDSWVRDNAEVVDA